MVAKILMSEDRNKTDQKDRNHLNIKIGAISATTTDPTESKIQKILQRTNR